MDETRDIMFREISQQRKTNTVSSNLYMESKVIEVLETENRMVVAKGWGVEAMASCWS